MLFNGMLYNEVANLGNGTEMQTVLLRNDEGEFLVFKEIPRESEEVFLKLKASPHPNLIQIHALKAVDEEKSGVFMEYFPSDTLEDRIRVQTFSLKETKQIMLQICDAVYHLHKLGIIHRDLKPFNILINREGAVKITDFGIARIYKKEKMYDTQIMGTAGYAAPEQFGFIQTDEKTDIYALGVIMNKMLTGKMPGEVLYDGDVRVGDIIRRCLFMAPSERCSIEEIEEALGGERIHNSSPGKRLLRMIPGFRTGNKVHMTLALVEYIYMALIYLFTIPLRQTVGQILLGTASLFLLTLGIGWFLGTWKKTVYRFHLEKGAGRVMLALLYGVILFFLLGIGLSGII